MSYNPQIHHRRSIRLKGYDYSQAGLYFITICCHHHQCRFGTIKQGAMILNEYGQIAHNEWVKLTERFPNFELDVFQIMPNHMHAIISLTNPVGTGFTPVPTPNTNTNTNQPNGQPQGLPQPHGLPQQHGLPQSQGLPQPNIGNIVGAYKSLVANGCLEIFKNKNELMGKLWQRDYYEHIIRNEKAYQNISNYIINNPLKWNEDKFYL